MNKLLLSAAMAGVLAANSTTPAHASDHSSMAGPKEKCYGVAAKGKNDCASFDGAHSCGGQAKIDNDPNEWKYVKQGSCKEMGGMPIAEMHEKHDKQKDSYSY